MEFCKKRGISIMNFYVSVGSASLESYDGPISSLTIMLNCNEQQRQVLTAWLTNLDCLVLRTSLPLTNGGFTE